MPTYRSLPKFKITTAYSGTPYVFENDQFFSGKITLLENGFNTATVRCSDYQSINLLAKLAKGETLKIEFKDFAEASWTTVFDGVIRFVTMPFSESGEILELKCDGAGYGFGETACNEEYGVQSSHPTLDHVGEIFTDASYGIIPKHVNCILGSADTSGYSYTTICEAGTGTIQYFYAPFKPCGQAINDVLNLEQATRGAAAGLHWIILPSSKFLCSTIGNHSAGVIAEGWTNYYDGTQADATLEQGKDFQQYYFQQLTKEANYILYAGAFRKPGDGDVWTENNSGDWGTNIWEQGTGDSTLSDENGAGLFKIGSYSLEAYGTTAGAYFDFYYPSSKAESWDLTKAGGIYNIPTVSFYVQIDDNVENDSADDLRIYFVKYSAGPTVGYCNTYFGDKVSSKNEWYNVTLPIGPNYRSAQMEFNEWGCYNADWTDVDAILFWVKSAAGVRGKIYIDGLRIEGTLLRAARETTINATNKLKMKVVTDDLGKDDSLVASDDTGTIAQLAYAELLRRQTTPTVGWMKTPYLKALLPGMLLHVHAKKKKDGTFNVDGDMRATRVEHEFSIKQYGTTTFVTSDVKNNIARSAFSDLNRLLSNARPEFQDRQATSIKTREIDITQDILVKTY